MRIKIGKYVLRSDQYCFILAEEVKGGKSKDGLITYDKIIGYYTTVESVLKAVPQRALMVSDVDTLSGMREELKLYQEIIKKLLV